MPSAGADAGNGVKSEVKSAITSTAGVNTVNQLVSLATSPALAVEVQSILATQGANLSDLSDGYLEGRAAAALTRCSHASRLAPS